MGLFRKAIRGGYRLAKKGVKRLWEKDHSLQASFGRERDLISRDNKGFSATGEKFYSEEFSMRHLLCIGGTGTGKSTVYQIPSICNLVRSNSSLIINDPSSELLQIAPYLASQGYTVYGLSPDNITQTIGYNPLHRVQSLSDCHKVATMLVNKGESNNDFWNTKSIDLITLIVDLLRQHFPLKHRNLANLYMLLETIAGSESVMNNLFAEKATERQFRAYQSLTANSENTRAGIISSALSHLSFIGLNDNLAQLTAKDTFSFSNFRNRKTALFINCKTTELEYYAPILGLFFEDTFKELLKEIPNGEQQRSVYMCIDELGSLIIPSFERVITNSRKYSLGIMGLIQNESQIFENYGEHNARSILNNATRIYMGGQDINTCESLSRLLGEYTYQDEHKNIRTRPLMTPSEIRNTEGVIIVPSGGSRPLHCKVTPWYKHSEFTKYMNMRPARRRQRSALLPPVEYLDLAPFQSHNT